ncbi:hypothetical protein [Actinomadura monticuli]|uniref:PH domain-containing protein n=1 Tax=Actinomadura monticuli TaxID=3097367 RepID=A0ABV4QMM2_9ACTN
MTDKGFIPVPPVIERRLRWTPVVPLLVFLGLLGAVGGGLGAYLVSGALVTITLVCLVAICFIVVMTVRSRTIIGLDGIRDRRPLTGEVLIPWSDITDAGVVGHPTRVVRIAWQGGRSRRTLSALREADGAPDGLGLDQLAAVIRHRAGLGEFS